MERMTKNLEPGIASKGGKANPDDLRADAPGPKKPRTYTVTLSSLERQIVWNEITSYRRNLNTGSARGRTHFDACSSIRAKLSRSATEEGQS